MLSVMIPFCIVYSSLMIDLVVQIKSYRSLENIDWTKTILFPLILQPQAS